MPEDDIPQIPHHRIKIEIDGVLYVYKCPLSNAALQPIRNVR